METRREVVSKQLDNDDALTACFGRGMKGSSELRCHLDCHAPLLLDLRVPLLDPVLHPAGEHALEDGGADIADPFFGYLVDLAAVGQVLEDALVVIRQELGDVLDGEAVVLWHGDVPDVLGEDFYGNVRLATLEMEASCKDSHAGSQIQRYLRFFVPLHRSLRK